MVNEVASFEGFTRTGIAFRFSPLCLVRSSSSGDRISLLDFTAENAVTYRAPEFSEERARSPLDFSWIRHERMIAKRRAERICFFSVSFLFRTRAAKEKEKGRDLRRPTRDARRALDAEGKRRPNGSGRLKACRKRGRSGTVGDTETIHARTARVKHVGRRCFTRACLPDARDLRLAEIWPQVKTARKRHWYGDPRPLWSPSRASVHELVHFSLRSVRAHREAPKWPFLLPVRRNSIALVPPAPGTIAAAPAKQGAKSRSPLGGPLGA